MSNRRGRPHNPEITRLAELLGIDRKMAGCWGIERMQHKLALRRWREKREEGRKALVGAKKPIILKPQRKKLMAKADLIAQRMMELVSKRRMA